LKKEQKMEKKMRARGDTNKKSIVSETTSEQQFNSSKEYEKELALVNRYELSKDLDDIL
jgi:hypothetical protein